MKDIRMEAQQSNPKQALLPVNWESFLLSSCHPGGDIHDKNIGLSINVLE